MASVEATVVLVNLNITRVSSWMFCRTEVKTANKEMFKVPKIVTKISAKSLSLKQLHVKSVHNRQE